MRAVERVVAIFDSFTQSRNALSLQEIADSVDLPKSTAFRFVQGLQAAGYLVRLEDKTYCLSLQFLRLAGLVHGTLDIRTVARPIMIELAGATMETVAIHQSMGSNRICIDSIQSAQAPLRAVMQPGEQIPLQAGSAAKVLLAHMSETELSEALPKVSSLSGRSQVDILAELYRVRECGFAVSHGERLAGLSAVSAPIKDARDEVRYCITVSGPTVRIERRVDEIVQLVTESAQTLSRQLGARTTVE